MDYAGTLSQVNWAAVLLATALSFVLGSVWYHEKVFGAQWMKLVGLKKKDLEDREGMVQLMGAAFLVTLVSNTFLAMVMYAVGTGVFTLVDGGLFGAAVGFFFAGLALGTNYLYEKRKLDLWSINVGYVVANFIVAGAVFGVWGA